MVQLLADPALAQTGTLHLHETVDGRLSKHDGTAMSSEEHAQRGEQPATKRSMVRAPRRGWSMTDYRGDGDAPHYAHGAAATLLVDRQVPIPENGPLPTSSCASATAQPPQSAAAGSSGEARQAAIPVRPRLPPPRRSYSVTDKEPEPVAPGQPRPSPHMTILDLPSEIHYNLLDFLDPIDGVCLGLAHSRLYAIHRRKYGKVSLGSRYEGPNDMEWAWRGAGPLVRARRQQEPSAADKEAKPGQLTQLRVQGQVYCRKCGVSRCELHRHLKDWMGDGYEYCEIRKTYGKPAGQDARPFCYMSSPKNPQRCGRHGGKRPVAAPDATA
ncbi:hypothetical protein CDD83_5098 [Cordyceps sp. RAO-2017]|nr:hypothetical protein CDD83_5098 [Cordyceps sp. RAO-2017]